MSCRVRDLRRSYLEIFRWCRDGGNRRPNLSTTTRFLECIPSSSRVWPSPKRRLSTARALYNVAETPVKEEVLNAFKETLGIPKQSRPFTTLHEQLNAHGEQEVCLTGYLGERSDLSKKLSFAALKDPTQQRQIQLVSSPAKDNAHQQALHDRLKLIRPNSPVCVQGWLKYKRDVPQSPAESSDGQDLIEVSLSHPHAHITPLNAFPKEIILKPETEFSYEQRHLQLRNDEVLRHALSLRSRIIGACRKALQDLGFLEVETPLLFKSTSEGAREFIVPTRRRGYAFALPQSPQQFKQLLMASGIDKYFQLAKCFRDEDLRADRQPEFLQASRISESIERKLTKDAPVQLDVEEAFSNSEKICDCVEAIVTQAFKVVLNIDLPRRFARMTYADAMSSYGSDKPDLRLPILPFKRVGHVIPVDLVRMITSLNDPIVEAMVIPLQCSATESRLLLRDFMDSSEGQIFTKNLDGGPGVFIYDSSKPLQGLAAFGFEAVENLESDLDLEDGFVIVLQARKKAEHSGGSTFLGDLRNRLAQAAMRKGFLNEPSWLRFEPVWITDFPLFSPATVSEPGQGGHAGFASTHHPFTSPKTPEDVDLLLTEPTKATGEHYDLVINGEEIGGGSQRIHQAAMQEFIFRNILKMDDAKVQEFSHLSEALRAGCPPHAGIALGMDRLVAMMASSRFERKLSMRDVIAFPKSGKGDDPMVKSPGLITSSALETYHLRLRE